MCLLKRTDSLRLVSKQMGISSSEVFEDQKFQNISAWLEDEIKRLESME